MTAPSNINLRLVVLTGPTASGKSTLAKLIQSKLDASGQADWTIYDADADHSQEIRNSIAQGVPPTEEYRTAWIRQVATKVSKRLASERIILDMSVRRISHRQLLRQHMLPALAQHAATMKFFTLFVPKNTNDPKNALQQTLKILKERQRQRVHEYANNPGTLAEQVASYEPPTASETDCAELDLRRSLSELLSDVYLTMTQ